MKYIKSVLTVLFILITYAVYGQVLDFHVVSFQVDAFDMTAKNELYREIDGSGSLYAIIKVSSQTPNDDVSAYQFHFGMMNHKVKNHNGEIWVYVQKNAKTMTISRNGYKTLSKYDLGTTIEEGKTYNLVLSAQAPVVYTQMVMFNVKPANSKAVVMIRKDVSGSQKEMFGIIDETGGVAKNLEFGTYTYEVVAENYHPSEGRFTLNDEARTHLEEVSLRLNGASVTLSVNSDAEIYVNNSRKGVRSWTGLLKAGTYQVECRQQNHKSSSQTITVAEGNSQSFSLISPIPIVGTVSVSSRPLGADIKIDGKDYGKTPRNITGILIGQHTLTLSRQGYKDERVNINVKDAQANSVNVEMKKNEIVNVPQPSHANTKVSENDKVFEIVEQNPMFPGGNSALMDWLSSNLKYPATAEENGIMGRVLVQFVVNKDGSIVEPKVLRSVDPALDKEAIRLVSSMPKWIPGKNRGQAVRVSFTLPITFRLQ